MLLAFAPSGMLREGGLMGLIPETNFLSQVRFQSLRKKTTYRLFVL